MAKGSALGPDLWSVMYDRALRIDFPERDKLISYADDVAALIRARDPDEAQRMVAWVCKRVKLWLEDHGLGLAASKNEVVALTRRRG